MYLSKTTVVRIICILAVVIVLWSAWKRIDAIIDNYQKYYDVALIQKIWKQEEQAFEEKWNKFEARIDKFSKLNENIGIDKQSSIEKEVNEKWDKYAKESPFPAVNKPVPSVADEYTKGYYYGLWNFFITSGFASIFAALFFLGSGLFLTRLIWKKIDDALVNKIMSKF